MQDFLAGLSEVDLIEVEIGRLVKPSVKAETHEASKYSKQENNNQDDVGYFDLRERDCDRPGSGLHTIGHSQVTSDERGRFAMT